MEFPPLRHASPSFGPFSSSSSPVDKMNGDVTRPTFGQERSIFSGANSPFENATFPPPAASDAPVDKSQFRKSGGIDALQPSSDAVITATQQLNKPICRSPIGETRIDPFKMSPQDVNTPHHMSGLFGPSSFNFESVLSPSPQKAPQFLEYTGADLELDLADSNSTKVGRADSIGEGEHALFGMDPLLDPLLDIDTGPSPVADSQFETPTSTPPPFQEFGPSPTGEHPLGEHPSRTLFVRNINSNVEDEELRALFEQYGPIRSMYTQCKHRGFVMISYFDIRHAKNAMRHLQAKVLRRRKLDIHYSIPKDNPSEKDQNQGTLVIFNLDPATPNDELKIIFGAHGEIKEIRETPNKKHHKFVEFFDVRDAEKAMRALNKTEIRGKKIKIEASRPGGVRKGMPQQPSELYNSDDEQQLQMEAMINYEQKHLALGNGTPFGSFPSSYPPVQQPVPKYSSVFSGQIPAQPSHSAPGLRVNKPRSPGPVFQTSMSVDHSTGYFLPSSPTSSPVWSPPHNSRGYGTGSTVGSFGSTPFGSGSSSSGMMSPKAFGSSSPTQGHFGEISLQHEHGVSPKDRLPDHVDNNRTRRSGSSGSDEDKSKFKLIIDQVAKDGRTTLMIKNIPNKYTQLALLSAVDKHHKGTYDFFYLPIDFKNKCNVGYAFINFISTDQIRSFYERFNNQKWEKYNSEKVCVIAYARIQGKNSLIQHFQNSSLMSEDKKCRPMIFHSDGPNVGEQEPFPVGPNIRVRKNSANG